MKIIPIAVAIKLRAVPVSVWSALNLIDRTDNNPEYNMPVIIAANIVIITINIFPKVNVARTVEDKEVKVTSPIKALM